MAAKAVLDAVEQRLQAFTRCPVRGLNEQNGDAPKGATAFLAVQYPVSNAAQISFGTPGANVFREEGAFRLVLSIRKGSGVAEAFAWADELVALFRAKRFAGVRTFAPTSPAIDDRNEEGKFFTLSIAVPYEHDTLG